MSDHTPPLQSHADPPRHRRTDPITHNHAPARAQHVPALRPFYRFSEQLMNPQVPLALRLSAQLLYGCVRIFRAQCIQLQGVSRHRQTRAGLCARAGEGDGTRTVASVLWLRGAGVESGRGQ